MAKKTNAVWGWEICYDEEFFPLLLVYACLYTCCSHFLTIIAGVDLHFRHESELPVCRTRVAAVQGEAANHYTNDAGRRLA